MAEKVIVAVDGGPASEAALEWVIDRAKTVELQLELTTVIPSDLMEDLPGYRSPYKDALEQAKTRATAALPDLTITTKVRRGDPRKNLIGASRHTDLLVLGTNKTTPIVGIMHGTLPLKVAGQAECATVVVPVTWRPNAGKVVVGWSDDETAEEALHFAAREASRLEVGLTIVHAWTAPAAGPMDGSASVVLVDELIQTNRALLADAAHRTQAAFPGLPITQGLHGGSAAVAIVRAASDASLVVVGSRGRGAVAGFFLGSVSHDVLLNMPAPVVVIPKKEEHLEVYPELVDEDL